MSRKIFFPLNGGVKQGKVEYILHLLLVFSLSDVSFVLFSGKCNDDKAFIL